MRPELVRNLLPPRIRALPADSLDTEWPLTYQELVPLLLVARGRRLPGDLRHALRGLGWPETDARDFVRLVTAVLAVQDEVQ